MINIKIKKMPSIIKTATGILPKVLASPAKVYPGESLVMEKGIKNKTKPLRMMFAERVSSSGFIFNCMISIPLINPIIMPIIRVMAIWITGLIPGNNAPHNNIVIPGAKAKVDSIERSMLPTIRTIPCANTKSPKLELW
jgi:hypothetical protein